MLAALAVTGCASESSRGSGAPAPAALTEAELRDPTACASCHPSQVDEWSKSMHAMSSKDPVFLAMNRRGQEETSGELGDFCVQCHAPTARALGLVNDGGRNLETLDDSVQGVTCYFCHSTAHVSRDNDNGLELANDRTMRGPIQRPVKGAPHGVTYSALHDRAHPESSDLCGSCHDVVLPNSVKLERTALEWRGSAFAPDHAMSATAVVACTGCHMSSEDAPSVVGTTTTHPAHDHRLAAVDVMLAATDDATSEEQRRHVGALLDTSLGVEICVQPTGPTDTAIYVTVENASAGHFFPSGASHDRRVWLELTALDSNGAALYSSGTVAPDEGGDADADLWSFGDVALKQDGTPAHMFWDVATIEPHAIPAPVTFDLGSPDAFVHHVTRRFPKSRTATVQGTIARVTVRARFRPIGLDVLDDLVGSGHLDAAIRDKMPIFDIVPNRHLSNHPTLSALAEETFEWSDAVLKSGLFATRTLNDDAFPKYCVATTARR